MIAKNVPSIKDGTILKNGTEYIFYIRDDVYFHNGDKLTPYDVKYSIMRNLLIGYNNGSAWILYQQFFGVSSYEDLWEKIVDIPYNQCLDNGILKLEYLLSFYKFYNYIDKHIQIKENEVIFYLDKPFAPFLSIMAKPGSWSFIYDAKQVIQQGGWNGKATGQVDLHYTKRKSYLSNHFQGSGPYVVTKLTAKEAQFSYYKKYYGETPYIKEQKFIIDLDPQHRYEKFTSGEYDIVIPYNEMLKQYQQNADNYYLQELPQIQNRGILLAWTVTPDSSIIYTGKWGTGLPINAFSDINMRRAFLSMFPFYSVNSLYWNGTYIQTPGAIPDSFPYFSISVPMWRHRDTHTQIEYFKKAWNGVVWKKGFKFTVYYFTGSKELEIILKQYAVKLKLINPKFNLIVKGVSWKYYLQYLLQNKLVVIASGWVADYYDSYDFIYPYMYSEGLYGKELGLLYRSWQKQNIDPIINKINSTQDKYMLQAYYNLLISYNYYFQLGVYIQSPKYILIHDEYEYDVNPMYSGVYFYAVRRRKN